MNARLSHLRVPVIRVVIGLVWIAGAIFNALWTLRHTSTFRNDLGQDGTFAVYRWFFDTIVGAAPVFWTILLIIGELGLGVLLLSRRRWARVGLAGSAAWSVFLSFVIWPYTLMMPFLALLCLWLLRYEHEESIFDLLPGHHAGLHVTGSGA